MQQTWNKFILNLVLVFRYHAVKIRHLKLIVILDIPFSWMGSKLHVLLRYMGAIYTLRILKEGCSFVLLWTITPTSHSTIKPFYNPVDRSVIPQYCSITRRNTAKKFPSSLLQMLLRPKGNVWVLSWEIPFSSNQLTAKHSQIFHWLSHSTSFLSW